MKTLVYFCLLWVACGYSAGSAAWIDMCIDPGHGGNDPGCVTVIPSYYEKHINLSVDSVLRDYIDNIGYYSAVYTRISDTYVSFTDRAMVANRNNAYTFISIHHNCVADTTKQYIHSLYSSTATTPHDPSIPAYDSLYSGLSRYNDSQLALKLLLRMWENWPDKHIRMPADSAGRYTILERTYMESAISEASFISQPSEAYMFYNNTDHHIEQEADAIFDGYLSYRYKNGIALVDYLSVDPYMSGLTLEIDSWARTVPYQGCWLENEIHRLLAIPFSKDGYNYSFHHWEHRNYTYGYIIDIEMGNPYIAQVDYTMDSTHWYRAVFTGGPFDFHLLYPSADMTEINKNDTITVMWDAPPGVLNSCSLYVDLSTNNQRTWSQLAGPLPYNYGVGSAPSLSKGGALTPDMGKYLWHTPNVSSDSCFLRIRGSDLAENSGQVVSHRDLTIFC